MDFVQLITALEWPASVGMVVGLMLYMYRDAMRRFDEVQDDMLALLKDCLGDKKNAD
jgi:hypothetical protein